MRIHLLILLIRLVQLIFFAISDSNLGRIIGYRVRFFAKIITSVWYFHYVVLNLLLMNMLWFLSFRIHIETKVSLQSEVPGLIQEVLGGTRRILGGNRKVRYVDKTMGQSSGQHKRAVHEVVSMLYPTFQVWQLNTGNAIQLAYLMYCRIINCTLDKQSINNKNISMGCYVNSILKAPVCQQSRIAVKTYRTQTRT